MLFLLWLNFYVKKTGKNQNLLKHWHKIRTNPSHRLHNMIIDKVVPPREEKKQTNMFIELLQFTMLETICKAREAKKQKKNTKWNLKVMMWLVETRIVQLQLNLTVSGFFLPDNCPISVLSFCKCFLMALSRRRHRNSTTWQASSFVGWREPMNGLSDGWGFGLLGRAWKCLQSKSHVFQTQFPVQCKWRRWNSQELRLAGELGVVFRDFGTFSALFGWQHIVLSYTLLTHFSFISILQRKLRNGSSSNAQRDRHQVCSKVLEASATSHLLGEADPARDRGADAELRFEADREAPRCLWDTQRVRSHPGDVRSLIGQKRLIKLQSLH